MDEWSSTRRRRQKRRAISRVPAGGKLRSELGELHRRSIPRLTLPGSRSLAYGRCSLRSRRWWAGRPARWPSRNPPFAFAGQDRLAGKLCGGGRRPTTGDRLAPACCVRRYAHRRSPRRAVEFNASHARTHRSAQFYLWRRGEANVLASPGADIYIHVFRRGSSLDCPRVDLGRSAMGIRCQGSLLFHSSRCLDGQS